VTDADGFLYTVCGLRVVRERPPEQWSCYSGVAAQMESAEAAVDWVTHDAVGDWTTGPLPVQCVDLALACVHPGEVPIVGGLNVAVDPVTDRQVEIEIHRARREPYRLFTVCGVDRATFETWWCRYEERSWLLAWVGALEEAEQAGITLLTARIHPGEADVIEGFDYADRLAPDQATMQMTVEEKWGQTWLAT
jgi:hypothetical protein